MPTSRAPEIIHDTQQTARGVVNLLSMAHGCRISSHWQRVSKRYGHASVTDEHRTNLLRKARSMTEELLADIDRLLAGDAV